MTPTPEELAGQFIEKLFGRGGPTSGARSDLADIIREAELAARNAALEEAATYIVEMATKDRDCDSEFDRERVSAAESIAAAIRNLKDKT